MDSPKTLATVFRALPELDTDATVDASHDAAWPSSDGPVLVAPSFEGAQPAARYDVKHLLGRGGMGEVRLCHDHRIGRDVAIKIAHVSNQSGVRARFLREARVQGQLEHPAIVPVYDLESFDDGSAYFAMKRVKGTTLASILAGLRQGDDELQKRFPLRKLVAAFDRVCLAVDFAHTKGVVHRDIKPANIMLGDFGEVYLLDWGLAKVVGQEDSADRVDEGKMDVSGATQVGSMLGTPGYMAPEQVDASIGAIGPATDVYALGAVLFEILSLQRYIEGKDLIELTARTLQGAERRPSKRLMSQATTDALDAVCERALALAPRDRLQSARELQEAVDAFLSGEQDRERRRALAREHLEKAGRQENTIDGRSAALRELGSAIALDSESIEARRELVRMLTAPPPTVPDAVKDRIREDVNERIRENSNLRMQHMAAFVPGFAYAGWLGFHELAAAVIPVVLLVLTAILSAVAQQATRLRNAAQLGASVAYLLAMVPIARVAGPLVIVPWFLIAYSVEQQMHPDRRVRIGVIIGACLSLTAAMALDRSGWFLPSMTFLGGPDGGILIHSRALPLGQDVLWFFYVVALLSIATPSLFVARTREALARAEARLHLQGWQLAQLVPPDAVAAAGPGRAAEAGAPRPAPGAVAPFDNAPGRVEEDARTRSTRTGP